MAVVNSSHDYIKEVVKRQRDYFATGATLPIESRLSALRRLDKALAEWERRLTDALQADLHKSYEEAYMTEISIVRGEIKQHLRYLRSWAADERVSTPWKMFPSSSRIRREPLGSVLIIAPWNYPVQLLLNPLVGAISAGCTACLKPSPYVPNVSSVLGDMIAEVFNDEFVAIVQGNRVVNQHLLAERFDLIFFTGSPALGRQVMSEAARTLTPVILELGGKSPCIVDSTADIRKAARRIAWGKCINAGQTCIAPDYLLVHQAIKSEFVEALREAFHSLTGKRAERSKHFARIVNERAFDRLVGYLEGAKVLIGGNSNRTERYIEPTVIEPHSLDCAVMQEEIFGPIFPLLTVQTADEAIDIVRRGEKPLALYYFGDERTAERVLERTSSGGACINDTIMHIANERLPFGGVGNSGMGSYHGQASYECFTHRRAVVTTPTSIDLPFRYMPYRLFSLVKKLL